MKQHVSLSLVLPAYNEAENLLAVVEKCNVVLDKWFDDFEIIVVDDGSTDTTQQILSVCTDKSSRVRSLHHEVNLGYGAALNTGFCASTKDYVMFMDSDQQFDIEEIARLIPYLDNQQIVTGFRENRKDPWYRRINALTYNTVVVKGLFGVQVKDVNCAFRIYPGHFIRQITPLKSTGALINCEVFKMAKKAGLSIHEVAVSHHPRIMGTQTGANLAVIFRMFLEAANFRWQTWEEEKRFFIPGPSVRTAFAGMFLGLLLTMFAFFAISKHASHTNITDTLLAVDRKVELTGVREVDAMRHLDAQWYLDIAEYGYRIDPGQSNVVFFPLYPMLIKAVAFISNQPLGISAQIVSTFFTLMASGLFCVFAQYYFRRKKIEEYWLRSLPFIAVGALFMHPMAIFLHAAYPESLFLTLCIAFFISHIQRKYALMLACAFLISLTRPQGLFIPLAMIGVDLISSVANRKFRISPETFGVGFVSLVAISLFATYLNFHTGDPFSFWTKRVAWDANASLLNIPTLLAPVIGKQHLVAKVLLYATLVGSFLLWKNGFRHVALVCAAFVIMPLYKGDLGDLSRYSLLAIFACLPFLAWIKKAPVLFVSGFAASACLNGLFLVRFLEHIWVG